MKTAKYTVVVVITAIIAVAMGTVASAQRQQARQAAQATPAATANAGGQGWTGPPGRWTLKEREQWVALEQELDASAVSTNSTCQGTNIVADYAHESFRGHFPEPDSTYGLDVYQRAVCEAAVSAINDVCNRGDMQRAAVRARINRVECYWTTATGSGHNEARLDGSTLKWTFNTDAAAGSERDRLAIWITRQL